MDATIADHPAWTRALAMARLARTQPGNFDAVNTAVQCLAALANDAALTPPAVPAPPVTPVPLMSVVVCSIDAAKSAAISANYRALFSPEHLDLIVIHDARGLNEAYNRGLDRARGDIVVFSHDDLHLLSPDFAVRLAHRLQSFDVIGVVGTTLASGPTFGWTGHPHSHGWVAHPVPGQPGFMAGTYTLDFSPVPGAQMLDGLWFAARTEAARKVRFDNALQGFHFYDVDFTYRCHQAGLRIGICPDLCIVHDSHGNFGESWRAASAAVLAKHPALRHPVGKHLHAYAGRVNDREGVRRFYAWLACLAREAAQPPAGSGNA